MCRVVSMTRHRVFERTFDPNLLINLAATLDEQQDTRIAGVGTSTFLFNESRQSFKYVGCVAF